MSQTLLPISVGELIGFVLHSGSLGSGFVSSSRAVEGTRGHQLLQRQRPPGYQSEVPVSYAYEAEPLGLRISGRIDGLLIDEGGGILVEEIKTTYEALETDRPDNPTHWAQARIYGYIVGVEHDSSEVDVQLTYLHLPSGRAREDRRAFTMDQLEEFFCDFVDRYLKWVGTYYEWCQQRDLSIEDLNFPFPSYRRGQEDLSSAVTDTIAGPGRLYASAPTGIGKTISTLFPAVKALGQRRTEKIFYLTAKTSGRTVAEKTFDDLRQAGLKIKSITLTARERICFSATSGRTCDPENCEYALGYYDRINDAILDIFQRDDFTRIAIEDTARRHTVCPFELSLDLSLWSDAIICDYNYVFDPKAYLRRYFLEPGGQYLFLVDEAHNLVDRAREMFSAELHKGDVLRLRKAVKTEHPGLAQALSRVNDHLLSLLKRCETEGDGQAWLSREAPADLLPLLQTVLDEAEAVLSRNRPAPYRQDLLELFFTAIGFLRVADLFDDYYVTCAEKSGRSLCLRLFCLDPSRQIRKALKRGTSAVFFSATLTPVEYFRDLLGGQRGDYTLVLDSPFPRENLALLIADDIDTTYRRRESTHGAVAASIAAAIQPRPGNYIVYFPSYRYLEQVLLLYRLANPGVRTLVQTPRMTEVQKEDFLAVFDADNEDTVVGFAVMGGIFGEGIDLMGERLIGAIVVGVGLPQICLERDLIRRHFDERDIPGFEYSYTFPGMNRVLQAAGRVIRSDADRGMVLLVDRRFDEERYRELFPATWHHALSVRGAAQIGEAVSAFWNGEPWDGGRFRYSTDF